jgi:hypothetical protein
MREILLIGATLIGAVMVATTPVSVKWSELPQAAIANILAVDQAQARIGHPGTAVSQVQQAPQNQRTEKLISDA